MTLTGLTKDITGIDEPIRVEILFLYEKQYSRQEVAQEIGISVRTLTRYLELGTQYIPDLSGYIDAFGTLNRRRIDSCHVEYLREIADLVKNFSRERVIQILTRKYLPIEN